MADQPVPYMERTRLYYRALGYESDYVWATFADVPFARLRKPLTEAKVALLTTASPPDRDNVDSVGVRHVWSSLVVTAPFTWEDPDWRGRYGHVDPAKGEELLEVGRQRRVHRAGMRPSRTINEA